MFKCICDKKYDWLRPTGVYILFFSVQVKKKPQKIVVLVNILANAYVSSWTKYFFSLSENKSKMKNIWSHNL